MSHLKNVKLIHVRFVKAEEEEDDEEDKDGRTLKVSVTASAKTANSLPAAFQPRVSPSVLVSKMATPAKSLGLTKLAKLARPITDFKHSYSTITVSGFDINSMSWTQPQDLNFNIEREPFSAGGFRNAYKANIVPSDGKRYVIKRYSEASLNKLQEFKETPYSHTRKTVQLHELARNYAKQLKNALVSKQQDVTKCFSYIKVSYGEVKNENEEVVTIEKYLPGTFFKYVNNDGNINLEYKTPDRLMAATLCHFSYVKSKFSLMLVDIQGTGLDLFDPEIATVGTNL